VADLTFADLPLIESDADLRRVHNTAGLFLVKDRGTAHSSMTCTHNSDTEFVNNPKWRVATDPQCRQLRIDWCSECDM
jgi:hypothetical protein